MFVYRLKQDFRKSQAIRSFFVKTLDNGKQKTRGGGRIPPPPVAIRVKLDYTRHVLLISKKKKKKKGERGN